MKKQALFMLGNVVFLIVPVVAGLAGFLDFRQLGFTMPTFLGFASGIVFGVFCVPLSYYPMNFVISKRKIDVPLVERARNSFLEMIPFLLFGASVEELFFRGFLVSLFLRFGSFLAVVISSVAHYFAHFLNPGFRVFEKTADKMLAASGWFLVTILLSFLFIYSESLAPVIITHSLASIGFGWMTTFRS